LHGDYGALTAKKVLGRERDFDFVLCRTFGVYHPDLLDDWPQEWWHDWLEQFVREPWTVVPPESPEQEQEKHSQAIAMYEEWARKQKHG
jgi:3-phenylpropionate/cinnamic acid dioxygenase small subunit